MSDAKRQKMAESWPPSIQETTQFDPTSVGLPADFVLTDWAKMKG